MSNDGYIPTDIMLKLFDNLNGSDKETKEQLKELTKAMTKLVIINESKNCPSDHAALKLEISDDTDDIISKLQNIDANIHIEITNLLNDLIGKVEKMILVVKVAFGLVASGALIGTIVVKFMS